MNQSLLSVLRGLLPHLLIEESAPFARPSGENVQHLLANKTTVWGIPNWPDMRERYAIAGDASTRWQIENEAWKALADHENKLTQLQIESNLRRYQREAYRVGA